MNFNKSLGASLMIKTTQINLGCTLSVININRLY